MTQEPVESRTLWRVQGGSSREISDWVVVEEPLEIRVEGKSLAVIMRTPGHDLELATGFCLTEGVVKSIDAIGTIRQCRSDNDGELNVVEVSLAPGVGFDHERLRRNLMASAACGVCGRASLEGMATDEAILLVSGRTSFEILQKASVAGIPVVCAVSGPTTLAIETARAFNITLINFLRGQGMNIASRPERVIAP